MNRKVNQQHTRKQGKHKARVLKASLPPPGTALVPAEAWTDTQLSFYRAPRMSNYLRAVPLQISVPLSSNATYGGVTLSLTPNAIWGYNFSTSATTGVSIGSPARFSNYSQDYDFMRLRQIVCDWQPNLISSAQPVSTASYGLDVSTGAAAYSSSNPLPALGAALTRSSSIVFNSTSRVVFRYKIPPPSSVGSSYIGQGGFWSTGAGISSPFGCLSIYMLTSLALATPLGTLDVYFLVDFKERV